jgi:hypothetical protein
MTQWQQSTAGGGNGRESPKENKNGNDPPVCSVNDQWAADANQEEEEEEDLGKEERTCKKNGSRLNSALMDMLPDASHTHTHTSVQSPAALKTIRPNRRSRPPMDTSSFQSLPFRLLDHPIHHYRSGNSFLLFFFFFRLLAPSHFSFQFSPIIRTTILCTPCTRTWNTSEWGRGRERVLAMAVMSRQSITLSIA